LTWARTGRVAVSRAPHAAPAPPVAQAVDRSLVIALPLPSSAQSAGLLLRPATMPGRPGGHRPTVMSQSRGTPAAASGRYRPRAASGWRCGCRAKPRPLTGRPRSSGTIDRP